MPERPSVSEVMHEAEVRVRVEAELDEEMELAGTRDQAMRAVVVSATGAGIILIPLAALVLGAAVRLFGLASGLY